MGVRDKTNMKVRAVMLAYDLPQWVLADMFNVSETSVSRAFRYEWSEEAQQACIDFIKGQRTDAAEVWNKIRKGGGNTRCCKTDGTVYESQEEAYCDRIIRQVEYVEARELLKKKGYL